MLFIQFFFSHKQYADICIFESIDKCLESWDKPFILCLLLALYLFSTKPENQNLL